MATILRRLLIRWWSAILRLSGLLIGLSAVLWWLSVRLSSRLLVWRLLTARWLLVRLTWGVWMVWRLALWRVH